MSSFKNLIYSLTLLSLSACTLPEPEKNKNSTGTSTFFSEELHGQKTAEKMGKSGYVEEKTYSIQVCLKDKAHKRPIIEHHFKVKESGQEVISNVDGCIKWPETVKFNFLATPAFIKFTRTIVADGLHKGEETISYALNPWETKGESVIDLQNTSMDHVLEGKEAEMRLKGLDEKGVSQRTLWIEDLRFLVTNEILNPKGTKIHYEVRFSPQLKVPNLNQEETLIPLLSGSVEFKLSIIHQISEEKSGKDENNMTVLGESEWMSGQIDAGNISFNSKIQFDKIPTRGHLFLRADLKSSTANNGLKPFKGYFSLGDYKNFKSAGFLKTLSEPRAQELEKQIQDSPKENRDASYFIKPKIEVRTLTINNPIIKRDTNVEKEVVYTVQACLQHNADQDMVRGQVFKVTKFRQKESDSSSSVEVKINENNSCLTWQEHITVSRFDCWRFLKGFVDIKNDMLGMDGRYFYYVNPWDPWGTTFARDARDVQDPDDIVTKCGSGDKKSMHSQLHIQSFSFHRLQTNYVVDHNLNLHVIQKVQVTIDPQVLFPSDPASGRAQAQKLGDGMYLLKMMIIKNPDLNSRYQVVSYDEKIADVISGQINTIMTFKSSDYRALSSRHRVLIQILPVDESKVDATDKDTLKPKSAEDDLESVVVHDTGLQTQIFEGPYLMGQLSGSEPVKLLDPSTIRSYFKNQPSTSTTQFDFKALIEQDRLEKERLAEKEDQFKNPEYFAKSSGLLYINEKGSTPSFLNTLMKSGPVDSGSALQICRYWTQVVLANKLSDTEKFIEYCSKKVQANPNDFFQFEADYIVKKVGSVQELQNQLQRQMTLSSSFGLSHHFSEATEEKASVGAESEVANSLLKFFNVGLGLELGFGAAVVKSIDQGNSLSLGESSTLTVRESRFVINLEEYKKCLIVKINAEQFTQQEHKNKFFEIYAAIKDFFTTDLRDLFSPRLNAQERLAAARTGIYYCQNDFVKRQNQIQESYFLVSQYAGANPLQDDADERNTNFVILLRGHNDYIRFSQLIKSDLKFPVGYKHENQKEDKYFKNIHKLFKGSGSRPGHYIYLK